MKNNAVVIVVILTASVYFILGLYVSQAYCEPSNGPYSDLNAQEVQDIQTEIKQPEIECFFANESEREIVTRVVMAESRGEGYIGMLAVANVILDRATLWGMTPVEVVTQDGQFAGMYDGEITLEAEIAVSDVFDYGIRAFDGPVTHFYSGEEPYWAEDKTSRGTISKHTFMY